MIYVQEAGQLRPHHGGRLTRRAHATFFGVVGKAR
jgi:hypothetical protein